MVVCRENGGVGAVMVSFSIGVRKGGVKCSGVGDVFLLPWVGTICGRGAWSRLFAMRPAALQSEVGGLLQVFCCLYYMLLTQPRRLRILLALHMLSILLAYPLIAQGLCVCDVCE